MKIQDIEFGWRNLLSVILGALIGLLLFVIRYGNDTTRWDMIKFQNPLSSMVMWAVLIASSTILITIIIYFIFFKLRYKVSSLKKRLDGNGKDGKNVQLNSISNKSIISLGIFIYMGLMFSIHAQSNMIKAQDQLLNMTILILLLVGFSALFTFIINYFIIAIYCKVSILEKTFSLANTNKKNRRSYSISNENTLDNRIPTKCIEMFLLGLSFVLVLTSRVLLHLM